MSRLSFHLFLGGARVFRCAGVLRRARIVRTWVLGGARVFRRTWILRCAGVFRWRRIPGRGRVLRRARILRCAWVIGHAWIPGRRGVLGDGRVPAGILRRGGVGYAGVCASSCGLHSLHERLALRLPREHALIPRGGERDHVGFEVLVFLGVGVHGRVSDERRGAPVVELPDARHLPRRTQAREVLRRSDERGNRNRVSRARYVHYRPPDGASPGVAAHAADAAEDFPARATASCTLASRFRVLK